MNVIVILNEGSGSSGKDSTSDMIQRIRSGFGSTGVEARIVTVEGADLIKETKSSLDSHPDGIVAAGGDGTISAVCICSRRHLDAHGGIADGYPESFRQRPFYPSGS